MLQFDRDEITTAGGFELEYTARNLGAQPLIIVHRNELGVAFAWHSPLEGPDAPVRCTRCEVERAPAVMNA